MRLWQNKDTIFFASFAAFLGVLCGQKLLTAKRATALARNAKKTKVHRYRYPKNDKIYS